MQTIQAQRETERREYLTQWARTIEKAAARGIFGKPLALREAVMINGPRAGAVEIDAGLSAGDLLRVLNVNESALLRQFIPWDFTGDPACFMAGRRVRLEAGWPRGLADDDIPLRALGQHPAGGGRWLVGRTERGNVLTAGLSDMTPHWLVSGQSGSGKTTTLVSAIGQLARDTRNRLVLIDAKHGASLRPLSNIRGLVGPLASDLYSARAALAWCISEMASRYSGGRDDRRLILVIDEVQELTQDTLATDALRKLVVQGRGAHIHCVVATQHPIVSSLGGPTVGRSLVGRLALRVADAEASRVAVGASLPRADRLLGRGDSYAIAPGAIHRVQVAYLDGELATGVPELAEWPESLDTLPDNSGWPAGDELGAAIISALRGDGRVKFQRACDGLGITVSGNDKAVRLLNLARDTLDWLGEHNTSVRPEMETHTKRAKKTGKMLEGVCSKDKTDGRQDGEQ
jgi:hypothetical protein